MRHAMLGVLFIAVLGCASGGARPAEGPAPAPSPAAATPAPSQAPAQTRASAESSSVDRAQYPSTYQRHSNPPVLIRNATIMTAAGQEIANGSILFKDGRIVAVGTNVQAPTDAVVVDGTGKYVTPGLIDDHSHLGVYAAPGTDAESDGNEATNPVTAEVWAEHSFWPQDPQIPLAIAGGITTIEVLRGHMYVQNHCYRADEMAQMIDLGHEFGFKIRSFHHAVESYKIADLLAREGVSVSVWADWWGFKEEAMDGIQQNAALNQQAGGRPLIHSDSPSGIQRLNQEAAKAMYAGVRAGIPITRDQALRWITVNPAWTLGLDSIVGTLEPGKMADVVVWSGDPFSVYSKAVQVYNDGWLVYDRNDPAHQPRTDFQLGQEPPPGSDR